MTIGIQGSQARNVELIPPIDPRNIGKVSEEEVQAQQDEKLNPFAYPKEVSVEDQLAQLAKQYGYDEQTAQQLAGIQADPQPAETQPQPSEVPPPADVPPAPDYEALKAKPEFEAFNNQLKEYFGITGDDLKAGIEEMQQYRQTLAEQKVQQQVNELKQAWGENYDQALAAVNERFLKLPANMQEALNNSQGAQLLYAQIQLEQQQQGSSVPQFDRPSLTGPAQTNKFQFTQSQLDRMSESEYRKNNEAITYAYMNGLVDTSR